MSNDTKSRIKINWVKGLEMENIEDKSITKALTFAIYCGGFLAACIGIAAILHQILK